MTMNCNPASHSVNYEELKSKINSLTPGDRRKLGFEGRIFDGRVLSKYFSDDAEAAYMPGNDR